MEPEPDEDEEQQQAAAAAATEAPDESAVLAARVSIAGHEVAVDSTALDVSGWKLAMAQVREVAGALAQLRCLRELVLDGVPVSGSTPRRHGDFQYGVDALDADMDLFRAVCEGLRALQGLTSLSLGGCYLGPKALALLAEVVFRDASAAVKKVALSGNPLTGGRPKRISLTEWIQTDGKDISGVSVLCPSMTQVTELDMSDCGLGPTSMPELAKLVSDATAALKKVVLSQNFVFGSKKLGPLTVHDFDADQTGWSALCDVLPAAPLEELIVADIGMGVKGVTSLAKAISSMAVINEVNVNLNPIGFEGAKALAAVVPKSSLQVIILGTACKIKEGVNTVAATRGAFAIMDGRGGELTRDPDSDGVIGIKLRWLDDGSESSFIKVDRLSSAVSSRADLLFGTQVPVNNSEVTELNFSCQNFGVAEVTVVAAAISTNAAVTDVDMSSNPITGSKLNDDTYEMEYDLDLSGVSLLFPAMTRIIKLNVSECDLGPSSMPELAKLFSDARAVLEEVNLAFNKIGAEGGAALVEALKTSNIKFLGIGKRFRTAGSSCITRSLVKTGVTLSSAGRLGKVTEIDSDDPGYIKLKWQDGGPESDWTEINTLDGEPLNLPLQSKFQGESLDVSHQQLDPGYAVILAWWLSTPFSAAVKKVVLSQNFVFGSKKRQFTVDGTVHDVDADQTGWSALCDALPGSPLEGLIVADIGMGVTGVTSLAKAISSMAVIAHVALSGNMITGSTDVGYSNKYDLDLSGIIALGEAVVDSKTLTSIDLSECGISVAGVIEVAKFISAGAAVKKVTLSQNKWLFGVDQYGDPTIDADQTGWVALCDALPGSPVEELDVADVGMGMTGVTSLAKAISSMAVLKKVTLSQNKLFGADWRGAHTIDADWRQSCWVALCDALPSSPVEELDVTDVRMGVKGVTSLAKAMSAGAVLAHLAVGQNRFGSDGGKTLVEAIETSNLESITIGKDLMLPIKGELDSPSLDASNQGINPGDVIILAWWLATPAGAAVTDMNMSGNPLTGMSGNTLTGGTVDHGTGHVRQGEDISGVSVLFPVMTKVITLNVSNCGLGPSAMPELSNLVSDATAAPVEVVILDDNPIGNPTVSMKPGARTGVTIKSGTFVSFEGRVAEVHQDPDESDSGKLKKLTWVDTSEDAWNQGEYIKASEVSSCVDSRSDLIIDYSHIQALGVALSKVRQLSLAECKFTGATLTTFVESVTWETAAINSLTIGSTGNMDRQVIYTLTADEDTIDLSQKNFGPADATLLTRWLQRPEVSATLGDEQWDVVATLLDSDKSPGSLHTHGDIPVPQHAKLAQILPCAAAPVVERVLATTPRVLQLLDFENAKLVQTVANSELRDMEIYSTPLGDSLRTSLARLARERRLSTLVWSGLQLGDGGAQQLVQELSSGAEPSAVTSLDLRQNGLTTLPLELLQLPALTELHFDEGNPGLDPTLAKLMSTQGLSGLFKLLPDLHGDPKPSYVLKMILAGPSMAGKTSLFNALRGWAKRLTHPEHGRTIGLDIGRLELRDARAGRYVVIFLTYDAGGHDEYQEMHQTFLSHNTLYILVWNVALESEDHQLEEKMASWATLLQTCAPGSRVLLVASHADEVNATVVPDRCQRMITAVRGMLDQHRVEQQRELDRLAVLPATDNEQARKQLLEEVLKNPLQLADRAVVVSAATLEGVPELRQCMLDAAFDKSLFPSFGSNQPNTYLNILHQARQNHSDQVSVTMAEMQASLSVRPDVSVPFEIRLVRSTVVNATADNTTRLHQALDAAKHAHWDELQTVLFPDGSDTCVLPPQVLDSVPHPRNYGLLHHLAYSGAVDAYQALLRRGVWFDSTVLTSQGETAHTIAEERQHPKFVELLAASAEGAATSARVLGTKGTLSCRQGRFGKFHSVEVDISSDGVLTMGSETADLKQAGTWVAIEKATRDRPFCLKLSVVNPARIFVFDSGSAEEQQRWLAGMQTFASVESSAATVEYTFAISLCGEQVKELTLTHIHAKQIHAQLAKEGVCTGLSFPDPKLDRMRDMVRNEQNVLRRSQDLLAYYQALFGRADTFEAFSRIVGFDLDKLRDQRCQLAKKVDTDPDLLVRAMTYLRSAGEVLCHDFGQESALLSQNRVFLEPQRLVDVMKELVHHDLKAQLEQIGPTSALFELEDTELPKERFSVPQDSPSASLHRLGQRFLRQGILERRLLPWLWRNLKPSVADDEAQIDFLLGLLVQLGLLTRLPGIEPPQWILPMRLPDRRTVLAAADARKRFARFLQTMDAGAATPAAEFSEAVDCIARAGVLPAEALERGCAVALKKAKDILVGAEFDAAGLNCHEIAAINFYTQEHMELPKDEDAPVNVYYPMNTALRRQEAAVIRPFWPYIKLLQQALLKLPPALVDLLFRGLRDPKPPIRVSDIQRQIDDVTCDVWWAFSSTTTNLMVATSKDFFGDSGHRVLFKIGSSAARDVKDYSAIPKEDELLMPCGIGFAPTKVEVDATDPEKLTVSLEQTEAMLLEDASEATALEVHQHPALAALAEALDGVATDYAGRRWDFHQPLPPGLFALVLSRCAALCTEQTAIWRRDLFTLMDHSGVPMEVSLQQQGLSYVLIVARCQAGGHRKLLQDAVQRFESEMTELLVEQWRGCSWEVVDLDSPLAEGVPPESFSVHDDMEPEPECRTRH